MGGPGAADPLYQLAPAKRNVFLDWCRRSVSAATHLYSDTRVQRDGSV